MTKNVEIEFKTVISESKYSELLTLFDLENNIFKQINHYFDTDDYELNAQAIVLRIRQKGASRFKVTLKSQSDKQAFENHVFLSEEQAKDMIENGFNTSDFFDHLDNKFVTFKVSLDNFRVSTPYANGTVFLDRCEYCGTTDFELEYEASNFDEGKVAFERFIAEQHIEFKPTKRKSERAFTCKR